MYMTAAAVVLRESANTSRPVLRTYNLRPVRMPCPEETVARTLIGCAKGHACTPVQTSDDQGADVFNTFEVPALSGALGSRAGEKASETIVRSTSRQRFQMWLMTVFAGSALLLAAIGVYGRPTRWRLAVSLGWISRSIDKERNVYSAVDTRATGQGSRVVGCAVMTTQVPPLPRRDPPPPPAPEPARDDPWPDNVPPSAPSPPPPRQQPNL